MNYNLRQSKMHSNTKEATAILEAVTSFGCILNSKKVIRFIAYLEGETRD